VRGNSRLDGAHARAPAAPRTAEARSPSRRSTTHPNVTIKKTGIPANELQKLQAQATTNFLPDIAMIDNSNYPVLAATNKLEIVLGVIQDV
jgi:hypothetical protein